MKTLDNLGESTGGTAESIQGSYTPSWGLDGTPTVAFAGGEIARVGRLVTIMIQYSVSVVGASIGSPVFLEGLPNSGALNCTNPLADWQRLGLIYGTVTTGFTGPFNLTIRNGETRMYLHDINNSPVTVDGSGNFVGDFLGVMSYIGPV